MVKLVVIYGRPEDATAFEAYYWNEHMPLVWQVPGIVAVETAKVLGTPDGGESPHYRVAELAFESTEAMQAALGSDEGRAIGRDLRNFATGGVSLTVAEVD